MAEVQIDEDLARTLEESLTQRYGLMLPSSALAGALGYPSMRAYHQAVARRTIPVPTFQIEHRRGRFALARDVARWLAGQYTGAAGPNVQPGSTECLRRGPPTKEEPPM